MGFFSFFNKTSVVSDTYEKLNPGQSEIVDNQGEIFSSGVNVVSHRSAYQKIEIVNRGVNLIVDNCSAILIDVGDTLDLDSGVKYMRPKKLNTLLNFRPNPYMSADVFKRNIFIDLLLEGNAFIYFDGSYLYNIPAVDMEIVADRTTFIREYKYNDQVYKPDEIIHIRDNSATSIFRGESRLSSAKVSINTLHQIAKYQENFFENSLIPGLVLKTKNVLSKKVKDRILAEWIHNYRPRNGGRKPIILDGEFELDTIMKAGTYAEIDFMQTVKLQENNVMKALGIPSILMEGGNNANIAPNLRLFYISTILPLVNKLVAGLEIYFSYDLKPVLQDVLALRPELRDLGQYLTSITNAGIITRNEARDEIRYPPHDEDFADSLVLPANVAGSAQDPLVGGKPVQSGKVVGGN